MIKLSWMREESCDQKSVIVSVSASACSSLLRVHIVGGNFVFVVSEGFGEQNIQPHLLSRGSVSSIYVIR